MNSTVAIILDGEFGGRLDSLQVDAIWIADSATNVDVVNQIRRSEPNRRIATFRDTPGEAASNALAGILPVVDLHHGPLSQDPPYERIEVYGCRLNHAARAVLREYEFDVEEETPSGFSARLSPRRMVETRQLILGLLELVSEPDAQRRYEVDVPIASVPGEMICMWFDDHYHPAADWFIRAFSERERTVLDEFATFFRAQLPCIRKKTSVAELHSEPKWEAVMDAARRTLEEFPGELGDVYPAADKGM